MKKNLYITIISVITIACILFGSYYHIRGFKNKFLKHFEDGFSWNFDDEKDESWDDVQETSFDETLKSFDKIDIDTKVCEITIKSGSDYKIYGLCNNARIQPSYKIENGTLYVAQKYKNHNNTNYECSVVITIPEGTDLNSIEIESNIGETSISNIKCKTIDIDLDIGELNLTKIDCDDIDVKTNIGEIDIYLKDKIDEYTIDAKSNLGEIKVDGHSVSRNYNKNGSRNKKLHAKTNIGEIRIN